MSKLTKKQSGYIGPQRSIQCSTCKFFDNTKKGGACEIVRGKISARGCCNLWTAPGKKLVSNFMCGKDIEDILFT